MSSTALVPTNGPAATQLAFELGADLSATGLELRDPGITFADWENIGRAISFVGNAYQWWVGDWINFGEVLFGEESAQAIDDPQTRVDLAARVTARDQGTLANWASTCRKVAKSRRRAELPFSHHVEVQSLEPDEQAHWLEQAISSTWTKSELREAIREAKGLNAPPIPPADLGPSGAELSAGERLAVAAELIYAQSQPTSDGSVLVPGEAWVQFVAALGKE